MINVSFNKGIFPDFLKVANIIPIHKKGKKLDPNNYRPIFLLSNISQLYEKTTGCSIFYPYKGMDDQISKNQCILQRTIV